MLKCIRFNNMWLPSPKLGIFAGLVVDKGGLNKVSLHKKKEGLGVDTEAIFFKKNKRSGQLLKFELFKSFTVRILWKVKFFTGYLLSL